MALTTNVTTKCNKGKHLLLVQTVVMFLSLPECYSLWLLSAGHTVFREADKHSERFQSRQKYVAFLILPSASEMMRADPRYETSSFQQTGEKQELQKIFNMLHNFTVCTRDIQQRNNSRNNSTCIQHNTISNF